MQDVRGLKRRCTDLEDAMRASKRTYGILQRTLRQDAAERSDRLKGLATFLRTYTVERAPQRI